MSCTPTPTETRYVTFITSSSSTTFSDSISTILPVVSTLTSSSCSQTVLSAGNETGCTSVGVPIVTTIVAGGETTIQVPIIATLNVTQIIPTATLFASCADQPPPPILPPSSTPSSVSSSSVSSTLSSTSAPSSVPSSSSTTPSQTFITTVVTPAPSLVVSDIASTQSDGSVTHVHTTLTSSMPPTTVVIPSPSPTPNQQQNDNNSPDTKGLIAPIVGGILGGFFGLIGIVVLIWYIWRKRAVILSRSPSPLPDISQMSYAGRPRMQTPDPTIEPKPYRYGGLGSTNSYGGSRPGTIRRSSMYSSHSPPPTSPHSYAGSPSPRLSSFSQGGAPTPPLLAGTALNPGPSQPSSRPSTPGYFSPHPHQGPPSAYNRQSWPLFGAAGEEDRESQVEVPGSPTFGMRNERRPSRLSLTLANWNPGAEEEGRTGSRSVSMSMSGMSAHGGVEAAARSETASFEGEPDSRSPRTTTLFVVNSDELSKAPT